MSLGRAIAATLLLLLLPGTAAAEDPVTWEEQDGSCQSDSYSRNQTWERDDGWRYYDQSGSGTRCDADARTLRVGNDDAEAEYHESGSYERETRELRYGDANRTDGFHGRDARTSERSDDTQRASVRALDREARVEDACSSSSSRQTHMWSTGENRWNRTDTNANEVSCWKRATVTDGDEEIVRADRSTDCRSRQTQWREHVYYEDEQNEYVADYESDAFDRECRRTTEADANGHRVAHEEASWCRGGHRYRDAETFRPDPWSNQIDRWERHCGNATTADAAGLVQVWQGQEQIDEDSECLDAPQYASESCHGTRHGRSGTEVTGPADARVFHGNERHEYYNCWDERDDSERWCHFDGPRSEGTTVEAAGASVFVGEQYEGSRWCHEPHEDCTRADRFYGIVVTGPVEHREPLPE